MAGARVAVDRAAGKVGVANLITEGALTPQVRAAGEVGARLRGGGRDECACEEAVEHRYWRKLTAGDVGVCRSMKRCACSSPRDA